MASTKEILAHYSPSLNEMARFVGEYAHSGLREREQEALHTALQIFFLNNKAEFRNDFLRAAGIKEYKDTSLLVLTSNEEYTQFLTRLVSFKGECIFLLKDAWSLMRAYQEKKGKGFGMLINRHFLEEKDQEENYFELIQPIYQELKTADSFDEFLLGYEQRITALISGDPHWLNRSKLIADYTTKHASENIIWVDAGFQFTFVLFCWASVRYHLGNKAPDQDFIGFAAYPWLNNIFKGKFFSSSCTAGLALEQAGIKTYEAAIADKAAGALVGFAIGDSLGFPAAGINKPDLEQMIQLPIQGFTDNPKHPYFGHLKPGQFTDNTNTLILTVQHLIAYQGLDIEEYSKKLVEWAAGKQAGHVTDRWLGRTAHEAIQRLTEGAGWQFSGSTTTESCSSLYRVLPLGIFFKAFKREESEYLAKMAKELGSVTHNSAISRTGGVLAVLIMSNLMNGELPYRAVRGALNEVWGDRESEKLIDQMNRAIEFAENSLSDEEAKASFGTGSLIWQTLPLATFYFLKYQNDFQSGVIAAANSYRDDSDKEKSRIAHFSWEEQIIQARGGNSDGIAALTGAFLGAYLGISVIPAELLSVEQEDKIMKSAEQLVKM